MTTRDSHDSPVVHLICNAHLDPVWLWEWEEGAAEALSTFRTAADLSEQFDGFVFNHNEAILYRWIEEYDPSLFARISQLVRKGRWHIMGGWYLQPDLNMPSGEALVRQALVGKRYFKEKFGVEPRTAIAFDAFGHDRGLVQILARSGSDAYIHGRPDPSEFMHHPPPGHLYRWVGYDGSEVLVCWPWGHYLSSLGKAREKIEGYLESAWAEQAPHGMLLWGVGNHGGGPSRIDLRRIAALMKQRPELRHSTPEAFFEQVRKNGAVKLPVHARDIRPWAVGCYTSMAAVKRAYRALENEFLQCEKMCAAARLLRGRGYPAEELAEAQRDLLFAQFHDILPGSGIPDVERAALRLIDHGRELLSRVRARAFFTLAEGQPRAKDGTIVALAYNAHPYPVTGTVEFDYNLAEQNRTGTFTDFEVYRDGRRLPAQVETEQSNIPLDWRKRVVVLDTLPPSSMSRFDCRPVERKARPAIRLQARNGQIRFRNGEMMVTINTRTGLIDDYRVRGKPVLGTGACRPLLMRDNPDPWGVHLRGFQRVAERFKPMTQTGAARFAGLHNKDKLPAVRVIEDGPARSVVEALLRGGHSAVVLRYLLPKEGSEIGADLEAHWNERDRMLKLEFPLAPGRSGDRFVGQAAYGVSELPGNGDESVARQWVAVLDGATDAAFTVINDAIYGSDFSPGRLRLSLLRSAAYACLPGFEANGDSLGFQRLPKDRYVPRLDQGVHRFRFWLNGGRVRERLNHIDREALARNEPPFALSFFPGGGGRKPAQAVVLDDEIIQCNAIKQAEGGRELIIRLYNPTDRRRATTLRVPPLRITHRVSLGKYEIRTLSIHPRTRKLREVDLLER